MSHNLNYLSNEKKITFNVKINYLKFLNIITNIFHSGIIIIMQYSWLILRDLERTITFKKDNIYKRDIGDMLSTNYYK